MIGPKKLSEIKRELRQALGNDPAVAAWLDQQASHSLPKKGRVSTVEEDSLRVRDLLHSVTFCMKPSSARSLTLAERKNKSSNDRRSWDTAEPTSRLTKSFRSDSRLRERVEVLGLPR